MPPVIFQHGCPAQVKKENDVILIPETSSISAVTFLVHRGIQLKISTNKTTSLIQTLNFLIWTLLPCSKNTK